MAERERAVPPAKSGDVASFVEDASTSLWVGARMMASTLPQADAGELPGTGFLPGDPGAWEVVYVKPLAAVPGKVRVYVRTC